MTSSSSSVDVLLPSADVAFSEGIPFAGSIVLKSDPLLDPLSLKDSHAALQWAFEGGHGPLLDSIVSGPLLDPLSLKDSHAALQWASAKDHPNTTPVEMPMAAFMEGIPFAGSIPVSPQPLPTDFDEAPK